MPTYVYKVRTGESGCEYCRDGFEVTARMSDPPLSRCPRCGSRIEKLPQPFGTGNPKGSLDRRAKEKGFHKLKKVDKGRFEKLY